MTELNAQETVLSIRCKDHPDNPRHRKSTFPHPGKILMKEWMEPNNITKKALSEKLDVTQALISKIIEGERDISIDMARKLRKVFGNNPLYWVSLQISFDDGVDELAGSN